MGVEILIVVYGPDKGLPVVAKDTPAIWGRKEDKRVWVDEGNIEDDWPGKYSILEITNMSAAQVQPYLERWLDTPVYYDPEGELVLKHRRKWRIVWDEVPQGAKDQFLDGFYSVTKAQIKPYFRNRQTNEEIT